MTELKRKADKNFEQTRNLSSLLSLASMQLVYVNLSPPMLKSFKPASCINLFNAKALEKNWELNFSYEFLTTLKSPKTTQIPGFDCLIFNSSCHSFFFPTGDCGP